MEKSIDICEICVKILIGLAFYAYTQPCGVLLAIPIFYWNYCIAIICGT